jgi:hypothetical protein
LPRITFAVQFAKLSRGVHGSHDAARAKSVGGIALDKIAIRTAKGQKP